MLVAKKACVYKDTKVPQYEGLCLRNVCRRKVIESRQGFSERAYSPPPTYLEGLDLVNLLVISDALCMEKNE